MKKYLLAPAILGGIIIAGGHQVQADSIDTGTTTQSIETQTVYLRSNSSLKVDESSQDKLVTGSETYQTNTSAQAGVSAVILYDSSDEISKLHSTTAVDTVVSSQVLEETLKSEEEERIRAEEEARRKAEEEAARKRAEEEAARKKAEEEERAKQERLTQATTSSQSVQVQSSAPAIPQGSVTPGSATITPVYSGNTYPVGQCTWGAKALAPWAGNYWGNAGQWANSARAQGYTISSTPAVGAIAVWPNDGGGYGHVAVVTHVESATRIRVQESNYSGNQYISDFRGWFNPYDGWWGGSVVYILPPA